MAGESHLCASRGAAPFVALPTRCPTSAQLLHGSGSSQPQLSPTPLGLAPPTPPQVPSLTEGGALWFTDLTSADPYYLLPALAGLSFLATIELGAADGMEGQVLRRGWDLAQVGPPLSWLACRLAPAAQGPSDARRAPHPRLTTPARGPSPPRPPARSRRRRRRR